MSLNIQPRLSKSASVNDLVQFIVIVAQEGFAELTIHDSELIEQIYKFIYSCWQILSF